MIQGQFESGHRASAGRALETTARATCFILLSLRTICQALRLAVTAATVAFSLIDLSIYNFLNIFVAVVFCGLKKQRQQLKARRSDATIATN